MLPGRQQSIVIPVHFPDIVISGNVSIMPKCDVCGKVLKNPDHPTHINSSFHQRFLSRDAAPSPITKAADYPFNDIVLFLAIKNLEKPNFSSISLFCSSFGIKNETIVKILAKKIKDNDVSHDEITDPVLKLVHANILDKSARNFPLTISVTDALSLFKDLNITDPLELIKVFKKLENDYPGLVQMSSSQLGSPVDLFTFKRIFPENVVFKLTNRWGPRVDRL
ncbi:MAG: hypothetical protein ACFFD4_36665 [Candidatus Odinarchaeota archaeon]